MSLSPIFSIPSFSSTEFLILRISCSSDNVEVTSTKSYRRGFLCVCYGYITRSKVTFCQRGLLLPVYLCVKVNAWMRKLLKTLVFDLLHLCSPIYKYIHRYIYKYIYICYTHCSSSSMSTLVVQDLHLIWAALMSSQGAKQLMSADWSYNIYSHLISDSYQDLCFSEWERRRGFVKKIWKCWYWRERGVQKMLFCTNIFWMTPNSWNKQFLNF